MISRYRRYQKDRHVKRKERIIKYVYCDNVSHWYTRSPNQLDGRKVHCSCGMCMAKTRNKGYRRRHIHGNYAPNINYKVRDLRRQQSMDADEWDYFSS